MHTPEIEPPHVHSGSTLLDRVLSGAAMLVAICSLAIAVYEARMTREHDKLSVWPYVTASNSYSGRDYTFTVTNVGLGPARIRSFQVLVDGTPQKSWGAVARRFVAKPDSMQSVYSSFGRGSVLLPGAKSTLFAISPGLAAREFAQHASTPQMNVRICYCSLYDECWVFDDSHNEDPKAVSDCPYDPATNLAL